MIVLPNDRLTVPSERVMESIVFVAVSKTRLSALLGWTLLAVMALAFSAQAATTAGLLSCPHEVCEGHGHEDKTPEPEQPDNSNTPAGCSDCRCHHVPAYQAPTLFAGLAIPQQLPASWLGYASACAPETPVFGVEQPPKIA